MNRIWLAILAVVLVIGAAWYMNINRDNATTNYRDGTYEGRSAADERGNYGEIDLTVDDGRITNAQYTEYEGEGAPKGSDYPYQKIFETIPDFEAQLVEKQNPERVDNITGSTGTWQKFKDAANNALESAR